jgi:hypothetical protein
MRDSQPEQRSSDAHPGVAIAVIAVALFAGIWTPWFIEYDEAVYAEVAHQMWQSGDWLQPRWNQQPFEEKPLLFYWLTAALFAVLGVTPLAPRLISATAAVATLALLARFTARRHSSAAAEATVWVAGAALLPLSLARIGLLDALLCAASTAALLSFHEAFEIADQAARRRRLALGYAATGVAMAVKGPVFPLVVGAVLLVDALIRRDTLETLRRSGLAWGAPIVLAIGVPANLPLLVGGVGGEFLGRHNLDRLLTPLQGHGGGPWYYLPILLAGLLPFSALVPRAFALASAEQPELRRFARFCLVWAAVVLVGFSLAATKLPQYIAPAIAPLAMLTGIDSARRCGRPRSWAWTVTAILVALVAAVLAAIPALVPRLAHEGSRLLERGPEIALLPLASWRLPLLALAAALAGGTVAALVWGRRGEERSAMRVLAAASLLVWTALWIGLGVTAEAFWQRPLRRLSASASQALPPDAPIHLLEMNHRVAPALETGRTTIFLRAGRDEHVRSLAQRLAGTAPVRVVMPALWWQRLASRLGGRELARDGAYVLLGEATVSKEHSPLVHAR